jgi:site-specific DNA recombinase
MKSYFAYIRVSTAKQGEHGSSLQEQRDAILAFAARNGLQVSSWFEERETAAKIGRHEFTRMLNGLRKGAASGVIFHKIDRSVRNLKDWSVIQDLADQGVDVRFAQESVNLGSNEGKLTGDFLAVISAHYIRNLREEVKKGMRGRLKQGLYPLAAPLGYLNQGGGKPKVPDPERTSLVRDAFELYAAGMPLRLLSDELYRRGLRSRKGNKVGANCLAAMLRNPFYVGIVRMKRSNAYYDGVHQPLISKALFDLVQTKLDGKRNSQVVVHDFLFRKSVLCGACARHLVGERQKGHVYYRCHTRHCPGCSIREERIDEAVRARLKSFVLSDDELDDLYTMNAALDDEWDDKRSGYERALAMQAEAIERRLSRLIDVYLDRALDQAAFEEKRLSLLMERKALEQRREELGNGQSPMRKIAKYLEHVKALPLSYDLGTLQEKRDVLQTTTSNLTAFGKCVVVELLSPFQEIVTVGLVPTGGPVRGTSRTRVKQVFDLLVHHFGDNKEGSVNHVQGY